MKTFMSIAMISLLSVSALAANKVQIAKDCAAVEAVQKKKNFIGMESAKDINSFKGAELKLRKDQLTRAMNDFNITLPVSYSNYYYELTFMGKKYDAISFEAGDNGATTVFIKNTLTITNLSFFDGDMYVDRKRCRKVTLESDTQY